MKKINTYKDKKEIKKATKEFRNKRKNARGKQWQHIAA